MPIVKGKHIVSFTDNEEREMKLEDEMPFMLESKLRELGANFDGGAPWTDKVVRYPVRCSGGGVDSCSVR